MKLAIRDISQSPKEIEFLHVVHLTSRSGDGEDWDYRFPEPVWTCIRYHRAGASIIFAGETRGGALGHCSRCLETYWIPLTKSFQMSLVPAPNHRGDVRLSPDDLDLDFYTGSEIDLGNVVDGQVILELPIRPLCKEECLGLCSTCGENRNAGRCACQTGTGTPHGTILEG